jgi:hypothetical protein
LARPQPSEAFNRPRIIHDNYTAIVRRYGKDKKDKRKKAKTANPIALKNLMSDQIPGRIKLHNPCIVGVALLSYGNFEAIGF